VGAKTIREQTEWIECRPENELNFIIELTSRELPVGMLSLIEIDMTAGTAEPARFLLGEREECNGTPVAVEAMKILYSVAFDMLKLNSLHGTILERNNQMRKWQRYLGMKEVGLVKRKALINGCEENLVGVTLTRCDYAKVARPNMDRLISLGTRVLSGNDARL
jgi:RimJ/RimL family protein N-acetyltransferase